MATRSWLRLQVIATVALLGCQRDSRDAASHTATAAPASSSPIIWPSIGLPDSEVAAGDIRLGMSAQDLRGILGPATRTSSDSAVWWYPNLKVELENESVWSIQLLDSAQSTSRGLRLGDDTTRVNSLYPPGATDSLAALNVPVHVYLFLTIRAGRVATITLEWRAGD